jgi:hypothetical protein
VAAITLSIPALPACGGEAKDGKSTEADKAAADKGADKAVDTAPPVDGPPPQPGDDKPADSAAGTGATPSADSSAPADGGAAPTAEGGEPAVDPIPALLEQAKNLDTDDAAATKALNDAVAAGAAKLDVAKLANERGEALLTKGESERAEPFFVWARDAHNLFAEPVYNLAKLAAYAGDLDVAKEHLAELEKRGNKKLMKKVGVDPAFAPLQDDPDVRKIFEQ